MEYGFRSSEDLRSSLLPSSASASASASASDGYFASLRAGLYGAGSGAGAGDAGRIDLVRLPIPAREVLHLELQKERIREEIRARENTQTRILEDEVRRELEFERTMAARRHEAERFTFLQGAPLHPSEHGLQFIQEARVGERLWPGPVPHRSEVGFNERLHFPLEARVVERSNLVPHRTQVGFDERLTLPLEARLGERLGSGLVPHHPQFRFDERLPLPLEARLGERLGPGLVPHHPQVRFDERLPLPQEARFGERLEPDLALHRSQVRVDETMHAQPHPKRMLKRKPSMPHRNPEFIEIDTSRPQLSGFKRKAVATPVAVVLPGPDEKKWSCAICQVSTTSEVGLKEHMQGKKHKANEESLATNEPKAKKPTVTSPPAAKGAGKLLPAKPLPAKAGPTNDPAKKSSSEWKQKQQLLVVPKKQETAEASERKPLFWCEPCKLKCNSQSMLTSHLGGRRHKSQLEGLPYDGRKPHKAQIEGSNEGSNAPLAKPESKKDSKPVIPGKPVAKAQVEGSDAPSTKLESKKDSKPVTPGMQARRLRRRMKQAAKVGEEGKGEAPKKEEAAAESTEAAAVEAAKVA